MFASAFRIAAALLREHPAVAELRRRPQKVNGRVVAKQGIRAAVGINRRRRHGVGLGGRRGRRGDEREEREEHHGDGVLVVAAGTGTYGAPKYHGKGIAK